MLRHFGRHQPVLVRIDPTGRWHYQKNPKAFCRHPNPPRHRFDRIPARLSDDPAPKLIVGRKAVGIDAAFPLIHGPYGEDGALQGLLEFMRVPYVGTGVMGSAVGMDKVMTKRLAREAGVPVLPYGATTSADRLSSARGLKYPLFVKPVRLGSAVGVYLVKRPKDLAAAVRKSLRFDTGVLIDQGVPRAREIEVSVLGAGASARASIPGEIRPRREYYDYAAKYLDPGGAELLVPARLSAAKAREARSLALQAYRALGCDGMARVDFLMDRRSGKLWFNELNTVPGFTAISMYPKLWAASGLPFSRLVERLVSLAVSRHRKRARLSINRD